MNKPTSGAAAVVLAIAVAFGAAAVDFKDAFRTRKMSYLMTPVGEIYAIDPQHPLHRAFLFHYANNLPYRWSRTPLGFVRWNSGWLVADGSNYLTHFRDDGLFDALVELPVRVVKVAATDDAVWAVSLIATNSAVQLWRSTDGHSFAPYMGGTSPVRFTSLANSLLILTASPEGDVYVASIIGPPIVHRVWPPDRRSEIRIAYSRSKMRAGMEEIYGAVDDVTEYSLPLRDILPLPDGGFAVLRNREDVRGATGKLELLKGRRADRYDRAGHQTATAVFARSVHWLTEVTRSKVIGVSNAGDVVVAAWGKPVPEEIVVP
ncbi:MAG TPA: hypothetical protein VLC46_23215 [Thermoanaerobaculia bacterium]|jgi:hypothetical protein|nr:hypothetical protein [Thermoanaerobaculia bacterium]